MAASPSTIGIAAPWVLDRAAHGGRYPALERLFWRGSRGRGFPVSPSRLIWSLFGRPPADGDVPVGALSRYADTGETSPECWLRADPVHLVANRDQVLLTGTVTDLSEIETRELLDDFHGLFGADGWRLEAGPAGWRLRPPLGCRVRTTPVAEVIGRDTHRLLPAGEKALDWHRFLNELQMFLHAHPVNAARSERGQVPINSLWPWGGGVLPEPRTAPWRAIVGGEPWVGGLARLAGISRLPLPDSADGLSSEQPVLVVLPEPEAPGAELERLERHWWTPLERQLRNGRVGRLLLYPGSGLQVIATRYSRYRIWRRYRPLAAAV